MPRPVPLFTIITPSYNQADYLEETIKSVLDQAGSFSIQYIVADGGSTDSSVNIIKKYEKALKDNTYPLRNKGVDFSWWSRPDKGQPDALNQGFKAARGKIAAWVNSDDVYEKGCFKEVAEAFDSNPKAGMIYGNFAHIDSQGKILRRIKVPDFDLDTEINLGNIIPTPSTFFRREAVNAVNFINPKYQYAFDYDLFLKIAKRYPVIHINSYWSRFRMHETSKTVATERKFWPEEREISRAHGGRFFSQHFIRHHDRYHHRTTFVAVKLARTARLLARGNLPEVSKRLLNNMQHYLGLKK
jgi:glycosyltransferase involved in cell wall biosynthesis